jgi:hypothetical protein
LLHGDPAEAGLYGFFGYRGLASRRYRAGQWRDMASYSILRADADPS